MTTGTSSPELPRGRRWAVRGLIALGTLVAVISIFAVWANRQLLEADNWAETSSELLADEAVRTQVAAFLVDEVYTQVDVAGEVAAVLPPRLDPLAGPAANGLRQLAERRTERLLERPRVQEAWEEANRLTAEQFIAIADGDSDAVTVSGSAVVLNLRAVLIDLVQRLGGSGNLVSKIPEDSARLTIMRSDQVSALQDAVGAVRGMSALLPGIAVALLAFAVFLARGRRRRTLMYAGAGFVFAGAAVLVARNLAGDSVVDALASTASIEPAVDAVWTIGTDMLRDVAQAAIVMGLPVVAAGWLAGPAQTAVALRRSAAPWLRARPGVAYAVLGAGLLLVIAWGPIHATRMVLPVLLLIGLAVLGLEALRRQTAAEFPDATGVGVDLSVGAGVSRAFHAATASVRGNGAKAEPAPVAAPAPRPATRVDQLERLAGLHERGALTDEEFAAEKDALLHPVVAT
jgi:Short C-terminal domain